MIVVLTKYDLGEQTKKNYIGWATWHIFWTGFGGKPEGKRQLGTPWHRWDDNIKTDLQEMDRRVWTRLIWFRAGICAWGVVNTVMILQIQYKAGNFMTS